VVGAAAAQVVMVFVVVAWSRRVSGCPGGLSARVLLVFVVVDAGVVFGLQATGREGSDGGFATQCAPLAAKTPTMEVPFVPPNISEGVGHRFGPTDSSRPLSHPA